MANEYQLVATLPGTPMQTVQRMADGAFIPFDPANRDYQIYLQFLEEGGVPDPAAEAMTPAWLAEGNEPDPAPSLPVQQSEPGT